MLPISIVIPTYNRAHILKDIIVKYTVSNVQEIIIIDDGSTDNTQEIILRHSNEDRRVKYYVNASNMGSPFCRNRGLALACGEWVFFGEDDAYPAPGAIEELYKSMLSTNVLIGGPRLVYLRRGEDEVEALETGSCEVPVEFDKERFVFNTKWSGEVDALHALMMVKRSVFQEIKYDENYRGNAYREETDFCLQARKKGHAIGFFPSAVMFHLPRVKSGGQWACGRLRYEMDVLRNNRYFYKKHYQYMKETGIVKKTCFNLQANLIKNRFKGLIKDALAYMGLWVK